MPYLGLLGAVLFCAIMAWLAAALLGRFGLSSRRRVVVLSATLSGVFPLFLIAIAVVFRADSADSLLYAMVNLIPALGLFAAIVIFISMPVAWLTTRRLAERSGRDIFE